MLTGRWYLDIIIVIAIVIIAIMVAKWLLGFGHPWFIVQWGINSPSNVASFIASVSNAIS
jgi:hypothetical protein